MDTSIERANPRNLSKRPHCAGSIMDCITWLLSSETSWGIHVPSARNCFVFRSKLKKWRLYFIFVCFRFPMVAAVPSEHVLSLFFPLRGIVLLFHILRW